MWSESAILCDGFISLEGKYLVGYCYGWLRVVQQGMVSQENNLQESECVIFDLVPN